MTESALIAKVKRYLSLEGILILVISDFLFVSGTSIWSPYLNIYYRSIGLAALDIGLISTLQSAVSSLTMMPAGVIADRVGRKKPIVLSFALTLIYTLSLILVRNYILILVITCIQGVAIGLRTPAISAYVFDAIRERRGAALATVHFFELAATIMGTAAGSLIVGALGYGNMFLGGAIIILGAGAFTFTRLKESITETTKAKSQNASVARSFGDGIGLMRDGSVLLLVAGAVTHQIGASFVVPYLGIYLRYVLALDLILVGLLMNARQIGDIVAQLPTGALIDRIGPEAGFFLHVFLTAPIVYFFASTGNPYLLFIILFVWGSEAGWDMPSRRMLMVKYAKGAGSATALGSIQSFIGLIALLSPAIGGWIWDTLGPTSLFQISALVNMVACVPLIVLMWKARKKG